MRISSIIAATLVAAAAATSTATADTESNHQGRNVISVESGKKSAKPISSDQRQAIKSAVKSGVIELHTESRNLSFDERMTSTNSKGEVLVMVPIENEGMEYSNLTAVLSTEGDITGYSESHFSEKSETSGHITAWDGGKKVKDEDVSAPEGGVVAPRSIGDAVSELNRCLSAAGIPAWVVAAATAVCSFGSLPGYIACLTAAGVGGGTAGYCGAAAWDKL